MVVQIAFFVTKVCQTGLKYAKRLNLTATTSINQSINLGLLKYTHQTCMHQYR